MVLAGLALFVVLFAAWFAGQYWIIDAVFHYPITWGKLLHRFYDANIAVVKAVAMVAVVIGSAFAWHYYRHVEHRQANERRRLRDAIHAIEFKLGNPQTKYDWADDPNAPSEPDLNNSPV